MLNTQNYGLLSTSQTFQIVDTSIKRKEVRNVSDISVFIIIQHRDLLVETK